MGNLFLMVGGGIAALYFLTRNRGGASIEVTGLTFNPIAGAGAGVGTTALGSNAGKALTAATGIPGFDKAGAAIENLFGKGRRQADSLVQGYQNPLGDYLAQVIAAWNAAVAQGKATAATREQVKQMLKIAQAKFNAVAMGYGQAGVQGIETIRHVIDDILIPDIDRVAL